MKRFGSGLFSAWPLLLFLKTKVSGLMTVICLVGGRLFDHLYPSAPWAFHQPHLTNYSIRLKVGNTHAVAQAYNFCTQSLFSLRAVRPCPPRTPPQASFLPQFASPLLPCSYALLPLSFQIWRGNAWWMGRCSCPLMAWFHCHSPPSPICSSPRQSVLHPPNHPIPLCLLLKPCGTGWAEIAFYSTFCFPINSGNNVFIWVWPYLKMRVKLGSYIFR